MTELVLTEESARSIRRLLMVNLGFVAVICALAIPLIADKYRVYGTILLGIAVVLGVVGYLALRAVRERRPVARQLSIMTGILLLVLSVPLMPIWIGLLTVVTGIGLLFVTLSAEREPLEPVR